MRSDRRTAGSDDLAAPTRADARQAVIQAWKRAGWPRPPRSGADYEHLAEQMLAYVAVVFPQMDAQQRGDIVGRSLVAFMAPLHARRPRHGWPGPEALVDALEDAALDRAAEVPLPGLDEEDQWVALRAFGSTSAGVRAGLMTLAAEGRAVAYRMVTKYLDLVDLDRTRPPRLADVVKGLGSAGVTEQAVREALRDFRRLVQVVEPRGDL
jgi:hypothetical protein